MCTNNCFHLMVKILYILVQISNVFYLSWELSLSSVSFLKGDLQFSILFKNTICIGVFTLKCTEKRLILFTPLHFLPLFVPHTEFKGGPEYACWNVLYQTSLRNYASFSLQVPSILSILLGGQARWTWVQQSPTLLKSGPISCPLFWRLRHRARDRIGLVQHSAYRWSHELNN
jgi:hypothetical protein